MWIHVDPINGTIYNQRQEISGLALRRVVMMHNRLLTSPLYAQGTACVKPWCFFVSLWLLSYSLVGDILSMERSR